ncbi:uncharacterized protein LOC120846092 [Ixodes scapularis]|uniref:uncharacterized protein LOC120846092 n=1 Tax=Ixodes scapularis TaxID=6945 RepID=UPI001A9DB1D3|nr:uncharacterized protein LOC120846092 [Ixodes scapularis]
MLLIIFAAVYFSSAVQNALISKVSYEHLTCLNLISKIGEIACRLVGEQGYDRLGESTCLIFCSGGDYPITLPDGTCDRIFEPASWQAYYSVNHELPPKEFQYCDEEWATKLQHWLEAWQKRNETVYNYICQRCAL